MSLNVSIINGKTPSGGVGGVSDADLSSGIIDFFTSGCVGTNDFAVQQQATPNKTVLVKAGTYYVPNATGTMYYRVVLSSDQSVTINDNTNANPRITSVVLKVDLGATPNNTASNVATLVTVDGTPAASPTAPTNSDIQTAVGSGNVYARLSDVTANSNFTSITTANIADKRLAAWVKATKIVQTDSIQDHAVTGIKLNTVTTSSSFSFALNNAAVTGLLTSLVNGSASGAGVYEVEGTVSTSSLGVPSTAVILQGHCWVHGGGNNTSIGYQSMAITSLTYNSMAFKGQIAGDFSSGNNFNTTNSKIEGFVRYIA